MTGALKSCVAMIFEDSCELHFFPSSELQEETRGLLPPLLLSFSYSEYWERKNAS